MEAALSVSNSSKLWQHKFSRKINNAAEFFSPTLQKNTTLDHGVETYVFRSHAILVTVYREGNILGKASLAIL